jgi:hypothetical protein
VKLRKYSQWKFSTVLGIGALLALVLCVQCVRTYLSTDAVLVPQQAEREAERQVGALTTAARSAGITDVRALAPVIEHVLGSSSDRVLWMRVLDPESDLLAAAGKPEGTAKIPSRWWERLETHDNFGVVVETTQGKALVTMLPFRLPRPPRPFDASPQRAGSGVPPNGHRAPAYVIEVAIPLKAVAGTFDGLRQNLIVGVIASIALLVSLAVIALRAPHYFRGKYLENELQLARRVQSDLQPHPHSVSSVLNFAASAVAADHVGGDFYDIFEAESGKVGIVLGDVSGKGIPAALLVSVLQGAIRSSMISEHESACERINRMLCERTAGERFATLFWGVFDPVTHTLRYVNAGHAAPLLIRRSKVGIRRLDEGGPVLGLLPNARYAAGTVEIGSSDTLVLYSDGINEAMDETEQEFGENRILALISESADVPPTELCGRIMSQVTQFASAGAPPDDRTLLVVNFTGSAAISREHSSEDIRVPAVA